MTTNISRDPIRSRRLCWALRRVDRRTPPRRSSRWSHRPAGCPRGWGCSRTAADRERLHIDRYGSLPTVVNHSRQESAWPNLSWTHVNREHRIPSASGKDIDPGRTGSYPQDLMAKVSKVFFVANDGAHGYGLMCPRPFLSLSVQIRAREESVVSRRSACIPARTLSDDWLE
jgi:hypothetical protein